jgi:hypothetical protein
VSDSLWVSTPVSLNLVIILIMADQGHFLTHELIIIITIITTTTTIIIIIIIIRAEVWWRIKCEAQVTSMKDIKWKYLLLLLHPILECCYNKFMSLS